MLRVPGDRTRRRGLLSSTAAVANPLTIHCSDPAHLQWKENPHNVHDPTSQPEDELEGSASFRAAHCPIERVLVIHVTLAPPATGPPNTTAFAESHQRPRRDGAHCKYRIDNRSGSDGGDCSAPIQFSVGTRSMWSITTTSTCCLRRSNLNPGESRRAKKMSVVGGLGRPRNPPTTCLLYTSD